MNSAKGRMPHPTILHATSYLDGQRAAKADSGAAATIGHKLYAAAALSALAIHVGPGLNKSVFLFSHCFGKTRLQPLY